MTHPIILPNGTKVVLAVDVAATKAQPAFHKGAVGMTIKAPTDGHHNYRVRFPDGGVGSFARTEFRVLHDFQTREGVPDLLEDMDLADAVIYRCVIGSRAYGLDHEGSDTDRRGIYLPPAHAHWSLYGVPEQLENKDNEEFPMRSLFRYFATAMFAVALFAVSCSQNVFDHIRIKNKVDPMSGRGC